MKTKTGASKVNISMPKELYDYLKKMVKDHNSKPENAYCPTDFSKMVQKAIREMIEREKSAQKSEDKTSNSAAPVGAKTLSLSESLGSGSSPATKKTSRRGG